MCVMAALDHGAYPGQKGGPEGLLKQQPKPATAASPQADKCAAVLFRTLGAACAVSALASAVPVETSPSR